MMATALAAAIMSAAVNFVGWMLFRRVIERQDKRMLRQEEELVRLRDNRVGALEEQMRVEQAQGADGRRRIYQTMEQRFIGRSEHGEHARAIDQRLQSGEAMFSSINEELQFIRRETASQGAVLKLIAKDLGVRVKGES